MSRWSTAATTPSPPETSRLCRESSRRTPPSTSRAAVIWPVSTRVCRRSWSSTAVWRPERTARSGCKLDRLYTDGKGQVVATHRATAQRAGRHLDTRALLTFTIVDGIARDIHGCQEDIAEWDEFWA